MNNTPILHEHQKIDNRNIEKNTFKKEKLNKTLTLKSESIKK